MLDHIKTKSNAPLLTVALSLCLTLLTGCSPHPGSGTWNSDAENQAQLTTIIVHFEPRAEILSSNKEKPDLHCSWSATDNLKIKLECLSKEGQTVVDIYQLSITGENKADLIHDAKVIGSFTKAIK